MRGAVREVTPLTCDGHHVRAYRRVSRPQPHPRPEVAASALQPCGLVSPHCHGHSGRPASQSRYTTAEGCPEVAE